MEKENGESANDGAGKVTQESLLDAASLFGAYWGRDGSGGGSGGAAAQAQAAQAAQAALFGFGGARYPPPTTLGVAANQAASLGLHPAASAAWWSMASHLAAQDYLARLQASGLSFPPMGDPYSALSALGGGMNMGKQPSKGNKGNKTDRSGRNSSSSVGSSASNKEKSPATSSASSQSNMRSSYGFPKTSSPSAMHATSQASLSSLASLNSLVSASHQSSKANPSPKHSRKSSTAKGSGVKDRDLALLRGDLMLAQAAAQGAYHAAVAAAKGGKNVNPMFNNPFGMGGSDKDRHSSLDSIAGLPHTILSDPASVLGGVRLPPDTEIIKYTSSIQGSKSSTGSGSNRGRKKTISLDPPHVSVLPSTLDRTSGLPSKRQKMDMEYGGGGSGSRSSVEVIRLPSRPQQGSALPSPTPFSLSDYAGLSKELLQSIANQSGLSLAALERELAGATSSGINLSAKSSNSSASASEAPLDLGISSKGLACDDDAPLNLSLKPSSSASTQASDALSRLTSLSSSLSAGATHTDRISRRKPGAKPRRVLPESESHITADSPRPKSSGSEDSESVGGWGSTREGRPRNLGRGVSKPKKNTVASLLAQSRALGLRPALAHQLLAETDIEKLKAALGEAGASTDSECPSDSCPSDSDASDAASTRRTPHEAQLRLPLALGWKRSTVIKGLSRSGCIKGDVSYSPPEPQSHLRIRTAQELNAFLDQNPCPPLTRDNFSYSARVIMGNYLQPGLDANDTITIGEVEITKRLEEARALAALSGAGGRPTPPPPVDRRIELARQQQAARDARRDASARGREQVPYARLARELERSEKAEMAKREKEARNQQMIEAKKRKQEELDRQKMEDQAKRQQEREIKRQQSVLMKEQKYIAEVTKQREIMYTVELERERRRQHTTLVRQLDIRRRWEERERRKHQNLMDRLLAKEKKLQVRRKEMELLAELRRPQEDSTLSDQKPLPTLNRIPGLKLPGQAMADILQVFEFIHNFGQTLGFDMESVPTLNTLQMALLPDCCTEAEEDLLSVLTHLLVCSIEDPGIPHPGRHTTLLGQALRMGDITPANISEVLRIYLYANATGEVKSLTGINQERERERRVADHHQTDEEMKSTCHNARNQIYYEHLHSNPTYRLCEALRDKPFLALCSTTKARILAFLCDELLQNKAVLRQIDASLEHLNQLKKERYLMDMKIRKVRVLHQRKVRAEQAEKQQALALERMQRLVEESTAGPNSPHNDEDPPSMAPPSVPERDFKEPPSKESSPCKDSESTSEGHEEHVNEHHSSPQEKESSVEKDVSPSKEGSRKNSISKELLNNNKDEGSPTDVVKDKDSMMGDEPLLSDVESEGTQPEEDEDKNLSSEELSRKLDKLLRQSEQQLQQLTAGAHSLRATSYGQDRYWRRYWSLGKCGGIFVEGMESAQPELLGYQQCLETQAKQRSERQEENSKKRRAKGRKGQKEKKSTDRPPSQERETKEPEPTKPPTKTEDQIKSELELKNIKSELNLSDHTQIIKYEPNLKGHCKLEGSPIKMEEKYIQQKQNKDELDMLDIEDSIPTAFLVQKPSLNKPMFAGQIEAMDKPQEVIKVENPAAKTEPDSKDQNMISDDLKDAQMVNNLEELRKMAEAMAQSQKEEPKIEEKEEKPKIKEEKIDPETAHAYLYTKIMEGRWFSILRKERSLLTNTQTGEKVTNSNENCSPHIPVFFENQQTCSEVIQCQGHKWDVSNNLHLLNDPSLFTLNSMVTTAQVPVNSVYADSSLTMSGIEQDVLDASLSNKMETVEIQEQDEEMKEENDVEKEIESAKSYESPEKVRGRHSTNNPLGLLNFNALSTYVTCDSPPPIQMSQDEQEQLEFCKSNGLPKKVDGNYVPKELRHGWWRITDSDTLKDLTQSLHPRGVRERELQAAILSHLHTFNNKLHIDKGDMLSTELSISHLDRVIAQNGGFPSPDAPNSYSLKTARRLDSAILEQVEQLEERIAAASLQVKGWRPTRPSSSPSEDLGLGGIVEIARTKLAALETNIERRYLKPPLGQSTVDATFGAVMQAESYTPAQSPHTPEKNTDGTTVHEPKADGKGIPRGLSTWRDAVSRCQTSAQLSMVLQALEGSIAWDKSIMKASCQFCQSGDNDDKLLLCDGCDMGYHTYCFKPKMDKIPDGDWYCWECVNKARGEKVCIVCGGGASGGGRGRLLPCTLCARAYHQLCHYPPLNKSPRGKWYCVNCIAKAPPKKPRPSGKKKDCRRDQNASLDSSDQHMVPSPAPSHASTSTTADDCPSQLLATPEKQSDIADSKMDSPPPAIDPENGLNHHSAPTEYQEPEDDGPPPEKRRMLQYHGGNGTLELNHEDSNSDDTSVRPIDRDTEPETPPPREREKENTGRATSKKDKYNKKQQKELQLCRNLLDEMELHRDSWPFLLPVNTKLFPTYKKVIRAPMDLSTIKRRLHDGSYKGKDDFASDVRQIFTNCEVFNEDESPVGKAGHGMRRFFEERWNHL